MAVAAVVGLVRMEAPGEVVALMQPEQVHGEVGPQQQAQEQKEEGRSAQAALSETGIMGSSLRSRSSRSLSPTMRGRRLPALS